MEIRFDYQPGETLVYETSVTTHSRGSDGREATQRADYRVYTEVLSCDEAGFRCRLQTRVSALNGQAASPPPPPWSEMTMDRTGRVLSTQDAEHPAPAELVFPRGSVEVGDSWDVHESADSTQMEVGLDEIVDRNGEQIAILTCGGETRLDEDTATATVEGAIHFSLTRGRKLWTRMLVNLRWDSGRIVSSTEETRLVS